MGYHDIIAAIAPRPPLDMGDLVIRQSPPSMGGMDIYRKSPDGEEKVTFLNEMGMEALGTGSIARPRTPWQTFCTKHTSHKL